MITQPFDYAAIVADLEAKKNAIEATIASLRSAMGLGALGQTCELTSVPGAAPSMSLHNGEIPNGAFLGKSIPEAAKLYLEILKKKQTSREIAEALVKGGVETTSKNFAGNVHAILDRARKSPNSALVKLGSHWGLSGWYPKGVVSGAAAPQGKKQKKKQRKSAKADSATPLKAEAIPISPEPRPAASVGKVQERITALFRSKPTTIFSAQDIAEQVGQKVQVARMILGTLARKGVVEKTFAGAYRAATTSHPMAASI